MIIKRLRNDCPLWAVKKKLKKLLPEDDEPCVIGMHWPRKCPAKNGFLCVGLLMKAPKGADEKDTIRVCGYNPESKDVFLRCVVRQDEAVELASLLAIAVQQALYYDPQYSRGIKFVKQAKR